jgi:hypothetical protein
MADAFLVLGQVSPAATTVTALYTVPAATSASVSSLVVCNRATSPGTFRVSVAIAGAVDATSQYVYYDETIDAIDTFAATLGITLATTDVVRCYSSNGTMNFHLFGVQIS